MQCRRVFVGESDEVGWSSVYHALDMVPEARIIGSSAKRDDLIQQATSVIPDTIVTAWQVEDVSVFPLLRQLRLRLPHSTFVILADGYDHDELPALDEIGIASYLLWKDLRGERLRIRLAAAILDGGVVISEDIAAAYVLAIRLLRNERDDVPRLSHRQLTVLRYLGEGLKHDAIATQLGLSVRTIDTIVADLKQQLDATTEFTLCRQAMRRGLLS